MIGTGFKCLEVSYKPQLANAKEIGLLSQKLAELFNLGTCCEFSSIFVNFREFSWIFVNFCQCFCINTSLIWRTTEILRTVLKFSNVRVYVFTLKSWETLCKVVTKLLQSWVVFWNCKKVKKSPFLEQFFYGKKLPINLKFGLVA